MDLAAGLLVTRSFQIVWGQVWKLLKTRQIIRRNEALDANFSKMLITGPFKVIEGQKFQKMAFLNTSVHKNIWLWTQACFEKIACFSIFVILLISLSSTSQWPLIVKMTRKWVSKGRILLGGTLFHVWKLFSKFCSLAPPSELES